MASLISMIAAVALVSREEEFVFTILVTQDSWFWHTVHEYVQQAPLIKIMVLPAS